jgi:hypothetical protein
VGHKVRFPVSIRLQGTLQKWEIPEDLSSPSVRSLKLCPGIGFQIQRTNLKSSSFILWRLSWY